VLEHKSGNISETRRDRGKVTVHGESIGSRKRSFERYHPRPPTASPSSKLGVCNPTPKLPSLLSQERLKLRTAHLASTFTGPSEHKPMKNVGEKGAWAYPGTAQFFSVAPIISRTGNATNFQFCTHILSIDRKKAQYKFREN